MEIGSKVYWQGYNDSQKQAERNWDRAKMELNGRFIHVLEGSKNVKGIGPKTHQALIEFAFEQMMGGSDQVASTTDEISKKERSRIVKELANTKWSELSSDQLIKIQQILLLN